MLGHEVAAETARLADHIVRWVEGHSFPMISPRPGAVAEGLLVSDLSDEDVARLEYYEGGFAYATREVLALTDHQPQSARVFFPEAGTLHPGRIWNLADWQARYGAAAVLAAGRFIEGFGRIPQEVARARYPALMVNAASRLRAGTLPAPATLRRRAAEGDVQTETWAEPYAAFFSVEEYDLRFRRFDGGLSPLVRRSVFLSGDAATVLPYDARRDRVAVIEQFRIGPLARGDADPWKLEPIAGRIDPGETPEAAVRREAVEEAGLELGRLWSVGRYYASPGCTAEYLFSYVGEADLPDATPSVGGLAVEDEDIRLHILSFDALMDLVSSGEAEVGPLLLSAWWLAAHRDRLRASAGQKTGAKPE